MKRKTLLALGIASALACGTSSAATFLCAQDEPNARAISCAEIPSEVLGSMTSSVETWVPSPPFVTYYLVPLNQDEVAMLEFAEPTDSTSASDSSDLSTVDQWQHSEPRSMTYYPSGE